tara:strand:- start:123 stop:509 length:387 start_codon:yes stop_codon:yes gene_type:complete
MNTKRYIPFFLFFSLFITGCKYGSFYEANLSCEEWKKEAGNYTGIIQGIKRTEENKNLPQYVFKDTQNLFPMRKCQFDKETNQVLGLSAINREVNKNYYLPQTQRLRNSPSNLIDLDINWEIKKRFKY